MDTTAKFAEHAYLVLRESDRLRFFDIRVRGSWKTLGLERSTVDADEGL